jgi:predicted CXXCH cytochrome family protein
VRRVGMSKAQAFLFAFVLVTTLVWARPQGKPASATDQAKNAPQESPANPSAPSEYVGAAVCKTCHADIYNGWEKSPHWKTTLDTNEGPSHQGCESCHGPGAAHVAGGGDVTKIFVFEGHSAKEIDARCMVCHAGGTQHMNAINSVHSKNDVSCISCHSPHHAVTTEFLLVKAQPELCYSCDLAKKAEFDMPFHHRVNEGLIQCTDCHNPHMLILSNVNLLCLQCHTTSSFSGAQKAPSFHNQASLFQSCVLCHSAIHGSNFDPTFFK